MTPRYPARTHDSPESAHASTLRGDRPRPAIPILAGAVPVIGALGLWALTGSPISLWFAALAPLLAIASAGDRAWQERRAGRRARSISEEARRLADWEMVQLRNRERDLAWRRSPDLLRLVADPMEIWRLIPGRQGRLLLGSGDAVVDRGTSVLADPLTPAVTPLSGESNPRAKAGQAVELSHAPVQIPVQGRIEVVGPEPLVAGAGRAMILQLCLIHPPGELEITGDISREHPWIDDLPHRTTAGRRRVAVSSGGAAGMSEDADAVIVLGGRGWGGGAIRLHLGEAESGTGGSAEATTAVLDTGDHRRKLRPQLLSLAQAHTIVAMMASRAAELEPAQPRAVPLGDLIRVRGSIPAVSHARALEAVIGRTSVAPFSIDLVADGPHALVAGTTGSGKSELLRTWVVGLAAAHGPRQVVFVLVDFKGGSAFESLRPLPHVVGILTDLDPAGATRGLESLRAEVRRREVVLGAAGLRDIAQGESGLARLVVVVDEFATLASAHPDLAAMFVDLAARGRALGIHVILGTQRATGVFREALLANCALRICLRAADAADSRLMIGDDRGSRLPAGPAGAGAALVRRSSDARAVAVQVATVDDALIAAVATAAGPGPVVSPWLPPLEREVTLPELEGSDELLVGLTDEPHLQRQRPLVLPAGARGVSVIGAHGSGVTTALRTLAGQIDRVEAWIGAADPEAAWDLLRTAATGRRGAVVIDEADALLAALPPEYAAAAIVHLEAIARDSGAGGPLLLGAERLGGGLARVADLLPHRLLLRHGQRADLVAHGGVPTTHDPDAPPGRGRADGVLIQVYLPPASPPAPVPSPPDVWTPAQGVTAWIARPTAGVMRVRATWERAGVVVVAPEEGLGIAPAEVAEAIVVVGDPDQWQRSWPALMAMRANGPVLIDVSCAPEYRLISGSRELPPLCIPGADRAWLLVPGRHTERVRLS